jgi:hypothetical protein
MAEVGGAPLIEGMPQTLMAMRELWEDLRPEDDPTRRPLWPLVKPVWDSVTTAGGFRPQSEHVDRYCLTVEAGGAQEAQPWLRNRISEACTKLRRAQKLDFEFEQVVLQADGCVGSQEAIAFVTRLLCRAPVVVFNLGGKLGRNSPALMMLLGIRAAVRRGLTVVVVGEKPDWAELPFNIKELHVLSLLQEDEETLSTVMSSGWTQLQQQSSTYRDMPVFDTVRQFGRRTLGSPTGKIEVFALCSFGTDYLDKTFRDLRSFVASASDDESSDDEGIYDLRPANDYLLPMLAGEKIYDLARFSECYLVDWTEWKANVFFELGVRLAVHRSAPICVIKKDQLRAKNRSTNLLSALSPLVYDPKDYRGGAFPAAFRKAERDLAKKSRSNLIYIAAERNAAVSYEMGSFPFVHEMVSQIREMVGDVKQRAGVFFLYDGNPGLAHQVWTSLIDRLTAADLLISHKLPLHAVGSEDHERLTRDGDYVRATLDRLRKIGKERGYASAAGAGDAR